MPLHLPFYRFFAANAVYFVDEELAESRPKFRSFIVNEDIFSVSVVVR